MKRYIFSLLAAIVALGAISFTKPSVKLSPSTSYTFYYVAPGGTSYTQANVEVESNWKTAPSPIPSCLGTNKACSIVVDAANTSGTGSARTLTFNLHAKAGAGGGANGYVPDLTMTTEIISNVNRP